MKEAPESRWRWLFSGAHPPWSPLTFAAAARTDVIAGLALWGFLVPEAIAYAGLTGVPAQAGLFTLMISLVVYGIFGPSRHMVVASTSAAAATAGGILTGVGGDRVHALAMLGIAVGVVFLFAAAMNLAFMVRFISRPVNQGFLIGLSIFIVVGQIPHLLGLKKDGDHVISVLRSVIAHIGETNFVTLSIGLCGFVVVVLLRRFVPKAPAGLIVTVLSIALSAAMNLAGRYDVEVVGTIPLGLPSLVAPSIPFSEVATLIGGAIGLALVIFTESVSISAESAQRNGYEVDQNQELRSFGLANIASAAGGGLVVGGSLSSTAVNEQGGSRTQLATTVTAIAALVTGLWLAPVLEPLPKAILAVLIIHAVGKHINLSSLQTIRRYSQAEFVLAVIALLGVIVFDVIAGLLIAVICNMVYFFYRSLQIDVSVDHDGAKPGELLLLVAGPIFYGNAEQVSERIHEELDDRDDIRVVVLRLPAQTGLDITTAEMLHSLRLSLQQAGVGLRLDQVPKTLRERILKLLTQENIEDARALSTDR